MISQYIYLIYIVFFYSSTHQYHVLGFINFFNTTAVSPCQLNFEYTLYLCYFDFVRVCSLFGRYFYCLFSKTRTNVDLWDVKNNNICPCKLVYRFSYYNSKYFIYCLLINQNVYINQI